jgi:hypothetical protein
VVGSRVAFLDSIGSCSSDTRDVAADLYLMVVSFIVNKKKLCC